MHFPKERIMKQARLLKQTRRDSRIGVSTVELIVACTLLSTIIGIGVSLMVRVRNIGRDAQYRTIALQEIANELTARLQSSEEARGNMPPNLLPSEAVLHRWPQASMHVRESQDDLGTRITVALSLSNDPLAKTLELSGWVISPQRSQE